MIISRKEKRKMPNYTKPYLKVSRDGRFYLSKKAVEILEIDEPENEGVLIGYKEKSLYIAYSNDEDCFKGSFQKGCQGVRFCNKIEQLKVFDYFNNPMKFAINFKINVEDVVIEGGYKFYKLQAVV